MAVHYLVILDTVLYLYTTTVHHRIMRQEDFGDCYAFNFLSKLFLQNNWKINFELSQFTLLKILINIFVLRTLSSSALQSLRPPIPQPSITTGHNGALHSHVDVS